jgi:4-hydroxy-tetrahydrodipicolinate synthase
VPVIVGCSAPATRLAVERAREAEDLGAAAMMLAPPNNQKYLELVHEPGEESRRHHDPGIDRLVLNDHRHGDGLRDLPVVLVDELPNCRYLKLKEAPTTIKISGLLSLANEDVDIFGGFGGMYLYEELSRGASGIMSRFAYPEILVEIYRLFTGGERKEAQRYFFEYLPLIRFEAQLGVGAWASARKCSSSGR